MARIFRPPRKQRARNQARTHTQEPATADITLTLDDLADDGRGVGRFDNKVVFVSGGLPGETVVARIVRRQKRFDEAEVLEVLVASEDRAQPRCPHYGDCGGCQLQHLNHDAQLRFKERRLRKLLQALNADIPLQPTLIGPSWHYRHRSRLAFEAGPEGGVRIGFRRRNSHQIVAIEQCPLLQAPLEMSLQLIRERLSPWWYQLGAGEISICRDSGGRSGVHLDARRRLDSGRYEMMAEAIADLATLFSVSVSGRTAWSSNTKDILYYQIDSEEISFGFKAGDFTQVNPAVNALMVGKAVSWLQPRPGDMVADCFCGLGNFSLPLAAQGSMVRAYELDATMLDRLRESAAACGAGHIVAETADLFEPSERLFTGVNKVVLDPPRAGAAALCELLAASRSVVDILYISCDPATLKRDLAILIKGGFAPVKAAVADMFPHSRHLESMVLLKKGTAEKMNSSVTPVVLG